ncbi:C6 zinc finger domain-containing protein [Fusarium circinatum]|uniref:C6 zinc finger domain-containing protein n=1 Tax=Fusarium circinatum TaxID=48490 RepID=A0A8H5WME9_FUSCI|nr:C6 zinc finger domain-containing protein [Fusarium circinatum]
MTYCGQPSTACHACKKKRGKCDKQQPACGQCIRKHIPCPGYRDPKAIIVRDQTSEVLDKARARWGKRTTRRELKSPNTLFEGPISTESRRTDDSSSLSATSPTHRLTKAEAIPRGAVLTVGTSLASSPQDTGTAFFLSMYAPTASLEFLSVIAFDCPTELLSSPAMLAPALAMLSYELMQPSLMTLARKNYLAAIRNINAALSLPQKAANDSTLASVLLLALFEAIAFHRCDSLNNWTSHVDGAVQPVKLRGPRQFESALGRALFSDVSNHTYASCAQRRVPVPATVSELRTQLGDLSGESSLVVDLGAVLDSMSRLLVKLTSTDAEDTPAPEVIVAQGCLLVSQIDCLLDQASTLFPYEVIPTTEAQDCSFNGIIHKYPTPQLARYWNILRVIKLFLSKWIHRSATALADCNATVDDCTGTLQQNRLNLLDYTKSNADRVAVDILCSVPFFQSLASQSYLSQTLVRWLVWPLSAVAASPLVQEPARVYARTRLASFHKDSRLPEVFEAVKMLDKERALEDW